MSSFGDLTAMSGPSLTGQTSAKQTHQAARCNPWINLTQVVTNRHGRKETVYHFHVTDEDRPVRLHMHGNDIFSGAHFGEQDADSQGTAI